MRIERNKINLADLDPEEKYTLVVHGDRVDLKGEKGGLQVGLTTGRSGDPFGVKKGWLDLSRLDPGTYTLFHDGQGFTLHPPQHVPEGLGTRLKKWLGS